MEEKKEIYTFKPDFTKEEVAELIQWFEERMDRLPEQMQINKSSRTNNLRQTVKKLISLLQGRDMTVTFCGYAAHLALIQKRLQMEGME